MLNSLKRIVYRVHDLTAAKVWYVRLPGAGMTRRRLTLRDGTVAETPTSRLCLALAERV